MNSNFWKNRKVFITGHTGFKGGWLSLWLLSLGAKVYGYSLAPPLTEPSFFLDTKLSNKIKISTIGDILDLKKLSKTMNAIKPSVVIHLAAQPLVLKSYKDPIQTYKTNVLGTVNVLEAIRKVKTVKAFINVTSDKCYKNYDWVWPYRENDTLGGNDPYSSSKACSEIITNAYVKSYFSDNKLKVATARAGNVLGGGDWSMDRLVPDFFRALKKDTILKIRYPNAIRPWQHVLEPLHGYLVLAEQLTLKKKYLFEGWNFGPNEKDNKSVLWIIEYLSKNTHNSRFKIEKNTREPEANLLKLDSSKSRVKLGWDNFWDIETSLDKTSEWYLAWLNKKNMYEISLAQIDQFSKDIKKIKK